jgi:hypothetical protein
MKSTREIVVRPHDVTVYRLVGDVVEVLGGYTLQGSEIGSVAYDGTAPRPQLLLRGARDLALGVLG